MRKLTDEELREPDVTLTIHPDALALKVSKTLEDTLRLYAETRTDDKGSLVFSIPAYRYREEIEPLLQKEANDWMRERCPTLYGFIAAQVSAGASREEILRECARIRKMNDRVIRQVEGTLAYLFREGSKR
jgi:hypothetical protein